MPAFYVPLSATMIQTPCLPNIGGQGATHPLLFRDRQELARARSSCNGSFVRALARTLLDIPCFKPKDGKAKRSTLIQAENDKGDLVEAFQDTKQMKLSEAEYSQIQDNVVFLRQDNKFGRDFMEFVRHRVKRHRPDMVFGDPLLALYRRRHH